MSLEPLVVLLNGARAELNGARVRWPRPGDTEMLIELDEVGALAMHIPISVAGGVMVTLGARSGWRSEQRRAADLERILGEFFREHEPREVRVGGAHPSTLRAVAVNPRFLPAVATLAQRVFDLAIRLDPLGFVDERARGAELVRALGDRLGWLSVDGGGGADALRARLHLEELSEALHAELAVELDAVNARVRFEAPLPPGAPLHLAPTRTVLTRFDIKCGHPFVDREIWARATGDKPGAVAAFELLAPALLELVELQKFRDNDLELELRLEERRLVAESGRLTRGSTLPWVEAVAHAWRALVAHRLGEPALIPPIDWF
jgi:hypothetical protein